MIKTIEKKRTVLWLLLACLSLGLFIAGCSGEKYSVDYCGQKEIYTDAEEAYGAGEKVELHFNLAENNKEYTFYLDEQQIQYKNKEGNEITIEFKMPDKNIALKCFEKDNTHTEEKPISMMLVDYYRAQLGAEGYDGYFEKVLSTSEKADEAVLDVYYKESSESEEECVSYIVPYQAAEDCYAVIEKYKMSQWNSMEDSISIDGALEVCKYLKDGAFVRISTEAMPENGREAIQEIGDVMSGYISPERRIGE